MTLAPPADAARAPHDDGARAVPPRPPAPDVDYAAMAAALADPDWQPTRDQVGWLVAEAFHSGAEFYYLAGFDEGVRAQVRESNVGWPPPRLRIAGGWINRMTRAELAQADREGRWPDRPRPPWAGYLDGVDWPPVRRPGTAWRQPTGVGWPS
jgi:hypothetical protein